MNIVGGDLVEVILPVWLVYGVLCHGKHQVISEEKIKLRNAKDGQTMDNTQLNQMTFARKSLTNFITQCCIKYTLS
jgi:hypothetical protein